MVYCSTMRLRVSSTTEVVEVFEARLLGDADETLSCTYGSTMRTVEFMAREMNRGYDVRARAIEVGAKPVTRFRVAVVDDRGRWMYMAHGATPQQARTRAASWIERGAAVIH